jgi:hypothetical protein
MVRSIPGKAKLRVLSVRPLTPEPAEKSNKAPEGSKAFRTTLYDYEANRTLFVDGSVGGKKITIIESAIQPPVSQFEFDAAVKLIGRNRAFSTAFAAKQLRPYHPMPPLIELPLPDGRSERVVAVGLLPVDGKGRHEIVGVNLSRRSLIRFERHAPENSRANAQTCGVIYAGQATAQHVAGEVWVEILQGNTVLWKFLAVRPAASSGTNGSGIELRYVDYRGKRLLYRAHVPILNVLYDANACGPYRDWQNMEGMIAANGTDVAPGFRLCNAPAQTILDSDNDSGNFLGVAIYIEGSEVVFVSEMEAGWYRYVSQWRFHVNGTLKPRFGFGAVSSSCVCNLHHHHCYWRFDFDIRTPGDNVVQEFNDPPIIGRSNWHTKLFEIKRYRDIAHKRKWRVSNSRSGEAYDIIPGPKDSTALGDDFGRGDVWVLHYRASEIDDGVHAVGPPYEADLDQWVNGESVLNQDVVVWYGAHFTHDLHVETGHIVGPDLVPVKW